MNISALNAPATPPYDYHQHSNMNIENNNNKDYTNMFFDRQPSPDHMETSSTSGSSVTSASEAQYHSAFRRVSPMSMPSPPELLIDSSEDEEDVGTPTPYISYSHIQQRRRKTVPHKSPSKLTDQKSIVFQISHDSKPKVLGGTHRGILWSLRQRVSMARHQHNQKLAATRPERRVKAMRIQIPKAHSSFDRDEYHVSSVNSDCQSDEPEIPAASNTVHHHTMKSPIRIVKNADKKQQLLQSLCTNEVVSKKPTASMPISNHSDPQPRKKSNASANNTNIVPTVRRKSSTHATSGRPSRVKGPCQACHETSDGCMRKAFNWPFPTSAIFNDKGKPFVYLCNKCGLRYNKSGGCVCRHCRWVLCKEEKRKAMQLIDQMRRSRPDGVVDLEEDIENFACSPKYWSCGRPWKVGWILNSQHDPEEEDELMALDHPTLSFNDATF